MYIHKPLLPSPDCLTRDNGLEPLHIFITFRSCQMTHALNESEQSNSCSSKHMEYIFSLLQVLILPNAASVLLLFIIWTLQKKTLSNPYLKVSSFLLLKNCTMHTFRHRQFFSFSSLRNKNRQVGILYGKPLENTSFLCKQSIYTETEIPYALVILACFAKYTQSSSFTHVQTWKRAQFSSWEFLRRKRQCQKGGSKSVSLMRRWINKCVPLSLLTRR